MGIPAYFGHLIRNYGDVMISRRKVERLYLDSNSIIYDVLRELEKDGKNVCVEDLYQGICDKINEYILSISPSFVFVAFDGIPPMAKLKQQKTRRLKTTFERMMNAAVVNDDTTSKPKLGFNTVLITPGTPFMKQLDKYIHDYFRTYSRNTRLEVIVSGSSEPGEGEHKIFEHIREHPPHGNCAVYGLDADLIMLALNHLRVFQKPGLKNSSARLYLYREAPEFIQSLRGDFTPNQLYFLDIFALSKLIAREMGDNDISNYIFMSFFLGNDFLPHFPILNIRTHGITLLMERFKAVKNKYPGFRFIDRNDKTEKVEIIWTNVKMFLRPFAENERSLLINELSERERLQKKREQFWKHRKEVAEFGKKFQDLPILSRTREKMIEPREKGWEKRYWRILFGDRQYYRFGLQKRVINNYCEGLEWVAQYYTYGTNNYVWYYQYNYPPLMSELIDNLPEMETSLLDENRTIMSNEFQLGYVIPKQYHELVGIKTTSQNEERIELTSFDWAFCRYFWEAHLKE